MLKDLDAAIEAVADAERADEELPEKPAFSRRDLEAWGQLNDWAGALP